MNLPLHPLTVAIQGAGGGGGGKGGGKPRPPVEAPDSLRSIAYARILDLWCEGEIYGFADPTKPLTCVYFNETPAANADGSLNFKNFQVDSRVGTQTQDPIEGFSGVESEGGIGVALEFGTPWTRSFSNINLTAVRIRLGLAALHQTNTTNGNIDGSRVNYKIEISADGGAFVEKLSAAFVGKATSPYERSHRLELPAATSGWVVRVTRTTPESGSAALQNATSVVSVTEIIDAKLRYPMSAYCGVTIDAEQFSNIPSRAYHLKGLILKVPSNYNPETRTYTGIWDGTFANLYSNNPAWGFYAMVTNPRYGLGHLVPAALIDKWALYSIAQYCDELVPDGFGGMEPRFTMNCYLQTQEDALKVLMALTSVFRGIMYATGGTITPVADAPADTLYTYAPANVIGGKFTYSGSTRKVRHTVALVSWNDMSDFGRAKIEYVDDPEGVERYGIQQTEVVAFGCTSRGQARRMGKYILVTERYETDMVSFDVGLDGTLVAPGKLISIADQLRAGRRTGGRIRTATSNSVTVDELPLVEIGNEVTVALPSGGVEKRTINNIIGNTLYVSVNFTQVPVAQSVWLLETANMKAQKFRVLGVAEKEDGVGHSVVAIKHVEGKFGAVEQNLLIEEAPISDRPPRLMFAPSNLMMTHRDVADSNTTQKIVTLTWDVVPNALAYYAMYRLSSGSWVEIGTTSSHSIDIQSLPPGIFEVQVCSVGAGGVRSQPTYGGPFDIDPNIKPPGFLIQINADIANALTTAQNAQAAADGAIDTFWQITPPTIGPGAGQAKVGDIWFDTDDGNHIWRVVGGVWTDAQDDAIAQAIAAAVSAQATADGKVKLFVGPVAPSSGIQLNDLWFDTTKKATFRYNGSNWLTPIADVTLDQLGGRGVNLLPDNYSTFQSATLPTMLAAASGTHSRDANVSWVPASASLKLAATGADFWTILAPTSASNRNIKVSPGKRYIVSAYIRTVSPTAGQFYLYDGVQYREATFTTAGGSVFSRVSAIIDLTASTASDIVLRIDNDGGAGVDMWVDGVMVEEAVGTLNLPSSYTRGTTADMAISAILSAANAQATADGSIDIFRQATPPTVAKLGDYWQDSDDGKWYWNTSNTATPVWQESPDNRIPQVVTDVAAAAAAANTAQSTANSKIRLFYQEAQPTATTAGDQWYQPSSKLTRYWNGTGWSILADQTESAVEAFCINPDFEQGDNGWQLQSQFSWSGAPTDRFEGGGGLVRLPSGTANSSRADNRKLIPVRPGQRIRIGAAIRKSAGADGIAVARLMWLRSDETYIGEDGNGFNEFAPVAGREWRVGGTVVTAPADAVYAKVTLVCYGHASGYWSFDAVRISLMPDSVDEVPHGATYGRTANADLYDFGGVRRLGLRIPGSSHRIGDQRNLPQSNTTAYGSIRNTTALTATSAGAVSVNAHTVRYGGTSVSYSAVSNAVTGIAQGTTVVIYCFDEAYTGGVRTWYAGINPDAVMQLGDGVVVAGQVTIPTSGSGGGGGGGGGGTPGDWCVDWDTVLPNGRLVRELELGDQVLCVDAVTGKVGLFPLLAIGFGEEECYRLTTMEGHSIVQSKSTPMDLPDGSVCRTDQMLDKPVWILGKVTLVVNLEYLGVRKVVKPNLGNRMFFAGERADATLATHNAIYKP